MAFTPGDASGNALLGLAKGPVAHQRGLGALAADAAEGTLARLDVRDTW